MCGRSPRSSFTTKPTAIVRFFLTSTIGPRIDARYADSESTKRKWAIPRCPPLVLRPMQRRRRAFAEQCLVFDREPPEFPEAMVHRNIRDGFCLRGGHYQRAPGLMHPAEPKIPYRAHAQMFLAADAK